MPRVSLARPERSGRRRPGARRATLQQQVGTGWLTLDEFSERSAAAYRARTLGDLAR
ncbi:MAG: DUF1707 SHOCT-like domain-containing protein [Pseudonocardiaceae bacterium]